MPSSLDCQSGKPVQINRVTPDVWLVWDLNREHLTIGGALVLRQEGEMIAQHLGSKGLAVSLIGPESTRRAAERLAHVIFGSSTYSYQVMSATERADTWPTAKVRGEDNFSYFSFSRVSALHMKTGLKPRLRWRKSLLASALQVRRCFPGKLYCVHLKSVAPYNPEESNAHGPSWNAFFRRNAVEGKCNFLLIGDDPLPLGLEPRPGLIHAKSTSLGLDLAAQLAMIGISDGFVGMASGLCTAAIFNDTPHVIFKHPAHHPVEMSRELGNGRTFPFAGEKQQLWRCEANTAELDKGFHLISS